jgi:hypothetical protein
LVRVRVRPEHARFVHYETTHHVLAPETLIDIHTVVVRIYPLKRGKRPREINAEL